MNREIQPVWWPYHILFYDGDCGFCNSWVQWVLKHDRKDKFRFASLQSELGQCFLKERGMKKENFDTVILWKPGAYYVTKSEAILKVAQLLGGKYQLLQIGKIIPKSITDPVYSWIAKRRKKLKPLACEMLSESDRKKMIGD